jgi:pre-mRNA-splicing factor CWC22
MMRDNVRDASSPEYQRITWEALKKSINGLVNKINASNVKNIVPELFSENLVRGKGLFARSVMKSQMASPQFSPVFAALVAVTNTKFPELGELVVKRVVLQFRRAFRRNDKSVCVAATKFLASLVNQQVCRSFFSFLFSSRGSSIHTPCAHASLNSIEGQTMNKIIHKIQLRGW